MSASKSKRSKKGILIVVAVLAVGGAALGIGIAYSGKAESKSTLPKELQLATLQAEAKDPGDVFRKAREAMRRDDLTEEQRREFRDNMRRMRDETMDEHVDEYYAVTPEEREKLLDRHIDEMQERMKRWRAEREKRERERKAQGERGDRPDAQGERGDRGGRDGQARGDRGPRRGRFGGSTPSERKARSESRDPDQSARRMAYFTALRKRAQERGVEFGFGRGRGGGQGGPRPGR